MIKMDIVVMVMKREVLLVMIKIKIVMMIMMKA